MNIMDDCWRCSIRLEYCRHYVHQFRNFTGILAKAWQAHIYVQTEGLTSRRHVHVSPAYRRFWYKAICKCRFARCIKSCKTIPIVWYKLQICNPKKDIIWISAKNICKRLQKNPFLLYKPRG